MLGSQQSRQTHSSGSQTQAAHPTALLHGAGTTPLSNTAQAGLAASRSAPPPSGIIGFTVLNLTTQPSHYPNELRSYKSNQLDASKACIAIVTGELGYTLPGVVKVGGLWW